MNVQTATTAELVAFYNEHSEAPGSIKKFADRKTAERRVSALIAKLASAEGAAELEVANDNKARSESSVSNFSIHGLTSCPSCGIHLSNGIGEDKQEVNGKIIRHDTNQFACLACGAEFGPAIRRRPAPSADRSAAIAATWEDPSVKAARSERSHVSVGGSTFRSVRDAFIHLGLPLEKHIKFRGQLKAAGTMKFGDHTFTIVAQQAL